MMIADKAKEPLAEATPDEPPPSYSTSTSTASGSRSTPSTAFKTKPTNFLALANTNDAIKGQFVIDPSLSIPTSMLPPLGDAGEFERKNLSLKSSNGSVNAEIWLLGSAAVDDKARRSTVALESNHGSITAHVHTVDAAPFSLTARSPHGSIRIALPSSFEGLLTISTRHGSVVLSDAILANATQLSQLGDARRYFVGDFNTFGDAWLGDEMELDSTHGSVRLKYYEEMEAENKKPGLLSRLFGK